MKHRHKLSQRQRQRPAPSSRRLEVDKTADEQPFSSAGNAKRRAAHHMHAEGKRPKPRLDKFRRGGRRTKRFDDGGAAAGLTRPNDPGNEIAGADRDRPKGALERLGRELMGPKSAYKRGGRSKKYDVGGVTSLAAPPPSFNTPTGADFAFSPRPNPIVAMVQSEMPPIDTAAKVMAARAKTAGQVKGIFPLPSRAPGSPTAIGNKSGGRIQRQQHRRRHFDDGGIADASPATPPALAYGNGPPAPPRIGSDGTPISVSAPRANDPTFLNRQAAAQKAAQMKQRIRQLEKGR